MKPVGFGAALVLSLFLATPVYSGDWRAEFKDLCGSLETASALSEVELKARVERCSRLLSKIREGKAEGAHKVVVFRLKKCKAYYEYLIELKHAEGGKSESKGQD